MVIKDKFAAIFPKRKKDAIAIEKIAEPFEEFTKSEASSGIILLFCTALAMILANTALSSSYFNFLLTNITLGFGDFVISKPLQLWVNDGLMAVFFLYVGLEIKRELMIGELNSIKNATLPVMAAIGGMVLPAASYFILNGTEGVESQGWGIPMATDIAFALGIVMMLGKRVPLSLKIFLTAIAIVDDLGAVMVIAIFYTSDISTTYLMTGIGIFLLLLILNNMGARHPFFYWFFGFILWVAFLKSGVHATVAGVLLAFTIPSGTKINAGGFLKRIRLHMSRFEDACKSGEELWANRHQQEVVHSMHEACSHAESPMQHIEHDLKPWVTYFIMPVFALANAGIILGDNFVNEILSTVSLGIIAGLVVGKPLGIALFTWLGVRLKLATLPKGATWRQIIGMGFLAGIGFTMSIFISALAFGGSELLATAKISILIASLIAGIAGWILLSKKQVEVNEG